MTEYDKGKHTVFYHRYHIVWITKYRYRVLTKAMKEYDLLTTSTENFIYLAMSRVMLKREYA
ncbi:putative transposase [Wolbachia pipientis wUni]|nr:putative transposase [Wolbachia pipientis wUni]